MPLLTRSSLNLDSSLRLKRPPLETPPSLRLGSHTKVVPGKPPLITTPKMSALNPDTSRHFFSV